MDKADRKSGECDGWVMWGKEGGGVSSESMVRGPSEWGENGEASGVSDNGERVE